MPEAVNEAGFHFPQDNALYYLGDKVKLREACKEIGFKNIKMWYQFKGMPFKTGEELWSYFMKTPYIGGLFQKFTDAETEQIKKIFIQNFDQKYGQESEECVSHECLVCIVQK